MTSLNSNSFENGKQINLEQKSIANGVSHEHSMSTPALSS